MYAQRTNTLAKKAIWDPQGQTNKLLCFINPFSHIHPEIPTRLGLSPRANTRHLQVTGPISEPIKHTLTQLNCPPEQTSESSVTVKVWHFCRRALSVTSHSLLSHLPRHSSVPWEGKHRAQEEPQS